MPNHRSRPCSAAQLAVLALVAVSGTATAQALLRNIRGATTDPGSLAADMTTVATGEAFFVALTPQSGIELWKTDGTQAGTVMVADVNPRGSMTTSSSGFTSAKLTAVGPRLFCVGYDGTTFGAELIVSDGTAAGTGVVKQINPTGQAFIGALTPFGSRVAFVANTGPTGSELWVSDGTAAGTQLVKDIEPGPRSSLPSRGQRMYAAQGKVFLTPFQTGLGRELWVSDGTAAGTVPVADIVPGSAGSDPRDVVPLGGSDVLFSADTPAAGRELWRSDGTAGGTRMVLDLLAGTQGSGPAELTPFAGEVYFNARGATGLFELWRTDGTAAGTGLLAAGLGTQPAHLTVAGSLLYFTAVTPAAGRELWRTDGTVQGTFLLRDIRAGTGGAFSLAVDLHPAGGDSLAFVAQDGTGPALWLTDGTQAGTRLVQRLPVVRDLALVSGNRIVFVGDDGVVGDEPWVSDGTASGTHLLLNANPAVEGSSSPNQLTPSERYVYFVATDTATGDDVYRSDGTAAGTILLRDLPQGVFGGPTSLVDVGERLFFVANEQLWSSDGTPAGTVGGPVFAGPVGFTAMAAFGAGVLFGGRRGLFEQLYRSDGSAAGTSLVKVINPTFSAQIREITALGSIAYFRATDGVLGPELWRSDGTAAGTRIVQDLWPGVTGADPAGLTASGGLLFFAATHASAGRELWCSDGTEPGTRLVVDLAAGPAGSMPGPITALRGGGVVFIANDGVSGREPWFSDGTAVGTRQLGDLWPGATGSNPAELVAAADRVYFTATTPIEGREPWSTDGTAAGTVLLRDLRPGVGGSNPSGFRAAGSGRHALFTATSTAAGVELWATDGTGAGTRMLADLEPGPGSSSPAEFTRIGTHVLFAAGQTAVGRELFEVGLGALGAPLVERYGAACRGTGGVAPRLDAVGLPLLGAAGFALAADGALPGAPLVVLLGVGRVQLPAGRCVLAVVPQASLAAVAGAAGSAQLSVPIPASAALLGQEVDAQLLAADAQGGVLGLASASTGLALVAGV